MFGEIQVLLTPFWEKGHIGKVSVRISADTDCRKGEILFSLNQRVINKQFLLLDGGISLSDRAGTLDCLTEPEISIYTVKDLYRPLRDIAGPVSIEYTVILSLAGGHPGFDLGYEEGGMTGSGMTFMPSLGNSPWGAFTPGADICSISMDWDLSRLPSGCRGVWAFGEGSTAAAVSPSLLQETFYSAGLLKSVEKGNFGFYWLKDGFNAEPIAFWTQELFLRMAEFFGDDGRPYSIFTRSAPYKKGGTALGRSYQYIFPDDSLPSLKELKFLFAHEIVHNWPHMKDEPFGTCTWYVEGAAEFYSAVLPWRYGLVSREELLAELNERAVRYYCNSYISISNEEAGRLLFTDETGMRIPYGRGFFYLMETDSKIRAASNGEKSLDDVILALHRMQSYGKMPVNEDWLESIVPILGEDAITDFESMRNGRIIEPLPDCFEGVKAVRTTGSADGTNTPCNLWRFE